MAKKYPPGYIKNPAKVAAGKARAKQAIRSQEGKYISKIFENEISRTYLALVKKQDVAKINATNTKEIAELLNESKVTKLQLKKFYEQNPIAFADLIENGTIKGTNRNSNQIEKDISDYKGQIYIDNGKTQTPVSKAEAKYLLMEFKQYLFQYANVVDFKIKPSFNIDGKQIIQIPDKKEFLKILKEKLNVTNYKDFEELDIQEVNEAIEDTIAEMFGQDSSLTIYSSPAKKKKKQQQAGKTLYIVEKNVKASWKYLFESYSHAKAESFKRDYEQKHKRAVLRIRTTTQ